MRDPHSHVDHHVPHPAREQALQLFRLKPLEAVNCVYVQEQPPAPTVTRR